MARIEIHFRTPLMTSKAMQEASSPSATDFKTTEIGHEGRSGSCGLDILARL
jgi:hypothetical protein